MTPFAISASQLTRQDHMKPIALALSLIFSSAAFAQTTQAPAVDASHAPAKSAVSPVPGVFPAEVNPFTGKPLSGEELQARLEASRMLTAALEEQLKQVTLAGEISLLPHRKGAEIASAKLGARGEQLKLQQLEHEAAEAARERRDAARRAKEAEKAAKDAAKRRAQAPVEVAPVAPVIPRPALVSVMQVGTQASAMLDFAGASLLVNDGEMTPLGPAHIVDSETVTLGGVPYRVSSSTLSRFATPAGVVAPRAGASAGRAPAASAVVGGAQGSAADGQAGPAGQSREAAPVSASAGVLVPSTVSPERAAAVAAESALVTGVSGTPARLPPLQLPPGLTVVPGR